MHRLGIRIFIVALLGVFLGRLPSHAQSSTALWDDSRVSAIYINIAADSLAAIYTDIYGTHYYIADMMYDDGLVRDTITQIGLRLRGNTSRNAAKKSFKISFNEFAPGRRYQGTKKLNLNGQHNDPTMIREKLFYEVWNQSGMPPRRTTFVQLYINGIEYGLYTCLEELDKQWLDQVFAENAGNLYKCTYPADMVYQGTNQQNYKNIASASATGGRAYDLQTNDSLDDYSDLVALITQLNRNPDAAFAADMPLYLDVQGFLKALAIDVATGNWDDYGYNKNNYYLYNRQPNGPMEFITYDTDNTFGVDWVQRDWATRDCRDWLTHSEPRPLASKLLAVPAFESYYYSILDSVTRYITRPDSIFPRIDFLRNLITPAAVTDTFRSLDYGYTFADFQLGFTGTVDGHTPYGIKPFLETRYTSTLSQLPAVTADAPQDFAQTISAFPNPVGKGQVLHLRTTKASPQALKVIIIDAMGRQMGAWEWPAFAEVLQLDISTFPAGHYLLRLQGKEVFSSLAILRM